MQMNADISWAGKLSEQIMVTGYLLQLLTCQIDFVGSQKIISQLHKSLSMHWEIEVGHDD